MPFKPTVGQKVHYYDHSRSHPGPYEATVESVNGDSVSLSVTAPDFKVDSVNQPADVHNPHVHGKYFVEQDALTDGNKLADEAQEQNQDAYKRPFAQHISGRPLTDAEHDQVRAAAEGPYDPSNPFNPAPAPDLGQQSGWTGPKAVDYDQQAAHALAGDKPGGLVPPPTSPEGQKLMEDGKVTVDANEDDGKTAV